MSDVTYYAKKILQTCGAEKLEKYIDLEAFGNAAIYEGLMEDDRLECECFAEDFLLSNNYVKQSLVNLIEDVVEYNNWIYDRMVFLWEIVLSGGKEGRHFAIKYDGEMQISDIELVLDVLEDYPFLGVYQVYEDTDDVIVLGCNGSYDDWETIPTEEGKWVIPPTI